MVATAMKPSDIPRNPDCTGCGGSTDGHYSYTFNSKTEEVSEILCRECDAKKQKEAYQRTHVLTSKLMTLATFYQCDFPQRFDPYYEQALREITDLMEALGKKIEGFGWTYRNTMNDGHTSRIGHHTVTALSALGLVNRSIAEAMRHGGRLYAEGRDPVLEEVHESLDRLHHLMKVWEREVWFGGLHEIVRNAKLKGHGASMPGGDVLSWACAGRVVFTLRDPAGYYISFITAEDEDTNRMGIQGILAKEGLARQLILTSIAEWRAGRLNFDENPNIGII